MFPIKDAMNKIKVSCTGLRKTFHYWYITVYSLKWINVYFELSYTFFFFGIELNFSAFCGAHTVYR